jgi:acyl-CoA hydrolase
LLAPPVVVSTGTSSILVLVAVLSDRFESTELLVEAFVVFVEVDANVGVALTGDAAAVDVATEFEHTVEELLVVTVPGVPVLVVGAEE